MGAPAFVLGAAPGFGSPDGISLQPIIERPDQGITLGDGTHLSARIWRPQASESNPVPAILEFLPYRKRDGSVARDALISARGFMGARHCPT